VNTSTSKLTANLDSLLDKLEKVIAKENTSNQKMIEHIYGEIQKCLAQLEKINDMRSDFSDLNNKIEKLFETIPNLTQKDVQDDIYKLNEKIEKLFETIPNPTQKDVEKGINTIFDNFTNKF
jgi:DNA repair exonuclease SbcCD ATPase subunit